MVGRVDLYGKALKCWWESKTSSKNEIWKKKTELRQLDNECDKESDGSEIHIQATRGGLCLASFFMAFKCITANRTPDCRQFRSSGGKEPFCPGWQCVCSVVNIEVYRVKRRKTNKNANARAREWYSLWRRSQVYTTEAEILHRASY